MTLSYPLHHMRGGTSTGIVLDAAKVPADHRLRDELLRHLMGIPQAGDRPDNRQITGLGRGIPTSNKVFLVRAGCGQSGWRLESTFAQLAAHSPAIDWGVNCGNMSAALPLWVLDAYRLSPNLDEHGAWWLQIDNTNTGITTMASMRFDVQQRPTQACIPGVEGAYPEVDLLMQRPTGHYTGRLLPTGQPRQKIGGFEVTCIDAAVPMVLVRASDFGKTATEFPRALEQDADFMAALRRVWIAAAMACGFRRADGSLWSRAEISESETLPKVAILGDPVGDGNIAARYFTPQKAHPSMAMSGACAIAIACLTPGTIASQIAQKLPAPKCHYPVKIEIPDGMLQTVLYLRQDRHGFTIDSAGYQRNAQILLKGHMPLYHPSPQLQAWLTSQAWFQRQVTEAVAAPQLA